MHVIVTTDGSKASRTAAESFKAFADPEKISEISVVAVIRPLAAVSFADDLSDEASARAQLDELSFREPAENATKAIAAVFDDWGPKVRRKIRSGSPATEIIKVARQVEAGLIVVSSGSSGLGGGVLIGSTAQRVQHYAECPVLVVRTPKRKRK